MVITKAKVYDYLSSIEWSEDAGDHDKEFVAEVVFDFYNHFVGNGYLVKMSGYDILSIANGDYFGIDYQLQLDLKQAIREDECLIEDAMALGYDDESEVFHGS